MPSRCDCGREFDTWLAAQEHRQTSDAHEEERLTLPPCCEWFPTEEAMRAHLADHNYHHICKHCMVDFPDMVTYSEHVGHLAECRFRDCNKIFEKDQLPGHLEYAHGHCLQCGTTYETRQEFNSHRENNIYHI
ncbi:hypothetical protein F5Y06DRAFT_291288 [Hypoxylon sp. FL0890]|nr:hypothetical protein F5Y06DRAFT_291288 [Hypoxylon sp. FL0890]